MNLMALIRQLGCPTAFFTLSCAEFDWKELLKEIAETVYRREFRLEEIEEISDREKNKLIADNVVQSTLHYNKRCQKLFSLMRSSFFHSETSSYFVATYYFRVEFQMRGAPHVHSLLWLQKTDGEEAPSYWSTETRSVEETQLNFKKIEAFADILVKTSPEDMRCQKHLQEVSNSENCRLCSSLKEKVKKYQTHKHTASCSKKGKLITIKKNTKVMVGWMGLLLARS